MELAEGSSSNPIINTLRSLVKENVKGSRSDSAKLSILDDNGSLVNLCKALESAFKHGQVHNGESRTKLELFDVLHLITKQQRKGYKDQYYRQSIPKLHGMIVRAIDETNSSEAAACLSSSKGKSRFMIRAGLNNGWLPLYIEAIRDWNYGSAVYRDTALVMQKTDSDVEVDFLEDEDTSKSATFLDIAKFITTSFEFKLDMLNRAFLEVTWDLPILKYFELIPTMDLGLMISVINGHVVVTKVKRFSVAGEDHKVEAGDILTQIDGRLIHGMDPDTIAKIVRQTRGKRPISIVVTKSSKKGKVFLPAATLLSSSGLDVRRLEATWKNNYEEISKSEAKKLEQQNKQKMLRNGQTAEDEDADELIGLMNETTLSEGESDAGDGAVHSASNVQSEIDHFMARGGHHVEYIGSVPVGNYGDKSLLDSAINRVANDPQKVDHKVSLHLMEFGVKMYCIASGQQVLYYPYPRISACGCSTANSHYFAFIAGNDLCALSTEFLCHVFHSDNRDLSEDIISSMAAGFRRTHHAA